MGVLYLNQFEENNVKNRSYAIILDKPLRYIELLIFVKIKQEKAIA